MVEVFKTNVPETKEAIKILNTLLTSFPASRINFDLDDCDKILRVEGEMINAQKVIAMVSATGYQCEVLL